MPRPIFDLTHVDTVRQVIADNPGLSIPRLCEPVRLACNLPSVPEAPLRAFITRHELAPVKPRQKRAAFRLLDASHTAAVRAVLGAHPGVSLRALSRLVQQACRLPTMNPHTLHAFIERYQLPRVRPDDARHQLAPEPQSRLGLDLARLWPHVIVTQEHAA